MSGRAADDYIEAIVTLREDTRAGGESIAGWFRERGFQTIDMLTGFLITGVSSMYRTTFGVDPRPGDQSIALPVPEELRDTVESITIGPIRRFQQ